MPEVTFNGWQVGMKKVAFIKMLIERTDLTLPEAKQITDDVLEGKKLLSEQKH